MNAPIDVQRLYAVEISIPITVDRLKVKPTDAIDSATVIGSQKNYTDNRLRGLSRLQRQILGIARSVNEHEHGGRIPQTGVPDFVVQLGVLAIYGIAPDIADTCSHYTRTKKYASAQAAVSRALSRLVKRGLMTRSEHCNGSYPGFRLTEIALQAEPVPLSEIDAALRFFGMKDAGTRWKKDEHGAWVGLPFVRWDQSKDFASQAPHWHADCYGKRLMYEDFDALRSASYRVTPDGRSTPAARRAPESLPDSRAPA